jgi:hypothetical protein
LGLLQQQHISFCQTPLLCQASPICILCMCRGFATLSLGFSGGLVPEG